MGQEVETDQTTLMEKLGKEYNEMKEACAAEGEHKVLLMSSFFCIFTNICIIHFSQQAMMYQYLMLYCPLQLQLSVQKPAMNEYSN